MIDQYDGEGQSHQQNVAKTISVSSLYKQFLKTLQQNIASGPATRL